MSAPTPALLLAAGLQLGLGFASASAQVPPPAPPIARTIFPRTSAFPPGGSNLTAVSRAHAFLAGGGGLLHWDSLNETVLMLPGWLLTGGVELPASRSWTLVPRAHLYGGRGVKAGNIHWTRLALDGRLSTGSAYLEAGLGMGVFDYSVPVHDAFGKQREQRLAGTPFIQVLVGGRRDPDRSPAFMVEAIAVIGQSVETLMGLELVAGFEF